MIDGQWLLVMLPLTVIMSMIMTKEDEEQDLFDDIIINVYTIIWKCRRAVSCGSCGSILLVYRCLVVTRLVPRETAAVSARSVYVIQPCTIMSHHFMQSTVHAFLDVTCHLYFWQNDRDLLRATAVTRGWNEHRNKSTEHLSMEKKILPPLLPGLEPATFGSRVRRSNH